MGDYRETKKVELLREDTDDVLDGHALVDVLKEWQAILDEVPAEYRGKVQIDMRNGDEYTSPEIRLYYERPETDEEQAERVAREKDYREQQEARERAQLAALKKKFGE